MGLLGAHTGNISTYHHDLAYYAQIVKLTISIPKNGGDKSSIGCSDHEAWDEETTGDTSSVRPTGNKEVHQKDDPEGGKGEGTWIILRVVERNIM